MTRGKCRLCDSVGELVESHFWPRFGYKLYAADQSQGGVFADLKELKLHGKHFTEPLFCEKCDNETLSRHETKAAKWCRDLEKSPEAPALYDDWLLPFVTSLSFRTALYGSKSTVDEATFAPAVRLWRQFLLGKRGDVSPFSQHLFIVFDRELGSHDGMCMWPNPKNGFVFTQFGPLWIVGLLGRKHLSLQDLPAWQHSQILPMGGRILPVSEWRVGATITLEFCRFLVKRRVIVIKKAVEFVEKENERAQKKAKRGGG